MPKGDARWGVGTVFQLDGLKEHLKLAAPALAKPSSSRFVTSALGGREFDKRIDVSWLNQPIMAFTARGESWRQVIDTWTAPYRDPRWMAEFATHLAGLREELGRYCLVSHARAACSSAALGYIGWTRNLCRVEAITLDLAAKAVGLELLDASEFDDVRPWVLDDENNWVRVAPRAMRLVGKTNGSITLNCFGWNPQEYGVQVNDVFWIPTSAGTSHHCGLRIAAVGPSSLTLAEPYTGTTSATWSDWKVLRTHETPPTNLEVLGAYPPELGGSDIYGRLADELLVAGDGTQGAFSAGGDPGFKLYE